MTPYRSSATLVRSLVAGVMVNVAGIATALAAPSFALPSLPFDLTTLPPRDILLWCSIALLVVALTAKIVRDRHHRDPIPEGPDLRWWKNPPPSPQL